MRGFVDCTVEYRAYIGEDGDYNAVYSKYTLEGVAVREVFAIDENAAETGSVTLYYFPERCRCIDSSGTRVAFPRPRGGDICVLHAGGEDERVLRVAEVGYFTGASDLTHIRLKLK